MKPLFALFLCAILLNGCATSDYYPYVGEQRNWPTAPGGFASEVNGIPIYRGRSLPGRPYIVLGKLISTDADNKDLAIQAKRRGADAVVITDAKLFDGGSVYIPDTTSTYSSGTIYGNQYSGTANSYSTPGYNVPVTHVVTSAWLIKYKTGEVSGDSINAPMLGEISSKKDWKVEAMQLGAFINWANTYPNGYSGFDDHGKRMEFSAEQIAKAKDRTSKRLQELCDIYNATNSFTPPPGFELDPPVQTPAH